MQRNRKGDGMTNPYATSDFRFYTYYGELDYMFFMLTIVLVIFPLYGSYYMTGIIHGITIITYGVFKVIEKMQVLE